MTGGILVFEHVSLSRDDAPTKRLVMVEDLENLIYHHDTPPSILQRTPLANFSSSSS